MNKRPKIGREVSPDILCDRVHRDPGRGRAAVVHRVREAVASAVAIAPQADERIGAEVEALCPTPRGKRLLARKMTSAVSMTHEEAEQVLLKYLVSVVRDAAAPEHIRLQAARELREHLYGRCLGISGSAALAAVEFSGPVVPPLAEP